MITKQYFCSIIDAIKRLHDFENAVGKACSDFDSFTSIAVPTLESELIRLLNHIFNCKENEVVGTTLEWWIYETNFGEKNPRTFYRKDGNLLRDMNTSTAEDLYDLLVFEMKNGKEEFCHS